jgi:4-amino-4-deoxy-L-arabinose transferase-like glycosyltransferase
MPRVRSLLRNPGILIGLIALILVPRLIGTDLFATVDEPYWLTAGSDFYYALGQRDFARTVYDYHPAVTTMWIVTTAMLLYFPQYRGLGQGYFDVYKDSLEQFLLTHGRTPLGLLTSARLVQVVLITLLLVLVFALLRRLLDERTAVVAVLLVSFDPFFLGHSRLLNHEVLMTVLAIVGLLSLLTYLLQGREIGWLIVSGVAAGLAQLTKSSSSVVIPVAVLLILESLFLGGGRERTRGVRGAVRDLAIWLAAMALV